MSRPVRYLTLDELLSVIDELSDMLGPVRDVKLLDSARARPQASAFGKDAYPTVPLKAAALMHSLAENQPLLDGNKRLALLATTIFLRFNGYRTTLDNDGLYKLLMDIGSGVDIVPEIAERLAVVDLRAG